MNPLCRLNAAEMFVDVSLSPDVSPAPARTTHTQWIAESGGRSVGQEHPLAACTDCDVRMLFMQETRLFEMLVLSVSFGPRPAACMHGQGCIPNKHVAGPRQSGFANGLVLVPVRTLGTTTTILTLQCVPYAGVVDLFLFVGPRPADVARQYAALTGGTAMPQMFAIGYHQCRWNYKDDADTRAV